MTNILLLVVALSMVLTPALFILYERMIAPRFTQVQEREADEIDTSGDIIIAGHGRFGGVVNRMLRAAGYHPTVLDFSSEHLDALRQFGFRVFFGDATRPDLLHAAGLEKARLLIIAINERDQITELVRYVRKTYPDVWIIARAVNRHHVYELYAAGCRDIIRETFDSSVRAGRSAYEALGHHPFDAEQLARKFTEDDRFMIAEMAEVFDPDIPVHENTAYVEKTKALMERLESEFFGKGGAFATRTERGWAPPCLSDVNTVTAEHESARAQR